MGELWTGLVADDALRKLLLALLLSGLVGLERERHGRAAGLRTHVMVSLGATILLIAARNAPATMTIGDEVANVVLDPNRIAAGIVTGIGFLGAGAMIRTRNMIRGLTTAACIWFVAALGIIIGNGLYALSVFSTMIVLLVLVVFDVLEHCIHPVVYRSLTVRVAIAQRDGFDDWCRRRLSELGMRIQDKSTRIEVAEGASEMIYQIRTRAVVPTGELVDEISRHEGVQYVRWDQP